ncbi:MAG: L,D-transpeptidase family protein [bacterium]
MHKSVLTPRGVHYDLDRAEHLPRWPWVLGLLLLLAVVAGLLLTFRPRLDETVTSKRSQPVLMPDASVAGFQAPAVLPNGTNRIPRWPASVDAEARHLVEYAEAAFRADDLAAARRRYLELLERGNLGAAATFVEQRLGEIGMTLVLTPRLMPEKTEYTVKRGESVDRIARQFNVTAEWLARANDIRNPERLQPGQRVRVLNAPRFAITVNRGANELRLFLNDHLLKRYAVGTGRRGETPPGAYAIRSRQERPAWWHPDGRKIPYGHRENILGTRWMSLQATGTTATVRGYGIHGTWNDADIGQSATAGCIRMRNPDVEELCLIVPEGTPVRIVD